MPLALLNVIGFAIYGECPVMLGNRASSLSQLVQRHGCPRFFYGQFIFVHSAPLCVFDRGLLGALFANYDGDCHPHGRNSFLPLPFGW